MRLARRVPAVAFDPAAITWARCWVLLPTLQSWEEKSP
jgi:hypothetical protein